MTTITTITAFIIWSISNWITNSRYNSVLLYIIEYYSSCISR